MTLTDQIRHAFNRLQVYRRPWFLGVDYTCRAWFHHEETIAKNSGGDLVKYPSEAALLAAFPAARRVQLIQETEAEIRRIDREIDALRSRIG